MTKRTGRIAHMPAPFSARQEEVSRVIRLVPMLPSLQEHAQPERFGVRCAASALAVLAGSATLYAVVSMLAR